MANTIKAPIEATKHPTTQDIIWAAAIFEGEGHFNVNGCQVLIGQKEPWLTDKLKDLFGGNVYALTRQASYTWGISGPRARGFVMTIYQFLSPHKQLPIRTFIKEKWSKRGPGRPPKPDRIPKSKEYVRSGISVKLIYSNAEHEKDEHLGAIAHRYGGLLIYESFHCEPREMLFQFPDIDPTKRRNKLALKHIFKEECPWVDSF